MIRFTEQSPLFLPAHSIHIILPKPNDVKPTPALLQCSQTLIEFPKEKNSFLIFVIELQGDDNDNDNDDDDDDDEDDNEDDDK